MPEKKRPLTYDDFWKFRVVQDVQVSPDGRRAAYVVGALDRDTDEARSAVWIVDLQSADTVRFTVGDKLDTQPRWSPDGKWLAFVSTREGDKPQVYVMPASGGEGRRITDSDRGAHTPAWSPDSRRVAFLVNTESDRQSVQGELDWLHEKEDARKEKPRLRRLTHLRYRFDGVGYLDTRSHLFVVDRDGGEARQLTDGDFDDTSPIWSPDGTQIAFVSNRTEDKDSNFADDIWLVDAETGALQRLTDGTLTAWSPSWSPDGSRIAFFAEPELSANGTNNTRVWAVSRAGGDQRDLMPDFDDTLSALIGDYLGYVQNPPVWSLDGSSIFFTSSIRGSERVCRVPAEGGKVAQVMDEDVHVATMSLTPDGEALICCLSTPVQPFDLFRVSTANGSLQQITRTNGDLLDAVCISPAERFTYPSADGRQIDGWLIRPVGRHERDAPLVLYVHGGPHGMYGNTFYFNMQVMAGAGVASLYINARGSAGYGIEFMRAVLGDWGGKDFQDQMNGVDRVLDMGGIDPGRLGIAGGSYGGFMTCWALGHTDRFAAGVSINPVINLVSFYGTSDIGEQWVRTQMGASIWERKDVYDEHSPLTYAPQVRTPLLLLHGENDNRCPIEQSEQMFTALKVLGREVEMVRIPGASHGLATTASPRHRIERWRLAKIWLECMFARGG